MPLPSPPDNGGRLTARLQAGLEARHDLRAEPSRFGDGMGWWAGRHEIVHFHDDHEVDLRLTAAEIRLRRAQFDADPNVVMRPSRSHWVALRFASDEHVDTVLALVDIAISAAGSRK